MAVFWIYLDRFAPQLALRFMMNRRNIRIKVMQVLYMIETEVTTSPKALLLKEFDKTRNLFVFLVHLLHQVALYAEVEANQRASKNYLIKKILLLIPNWLVIYWFGKPWKWTLSKLQ
jgi:hypothetical protein